MLNIPLYKFDSFAFNEKIASLIETSNQYGFTHLPIVEKGIYRGMIRTDDIIDVENQEDRLEKHAYLMEKLYLSDRMNWTEILSILMRNEANVMGVLDLSGKFIGIKLLDDIISLIGEKHFINKEGYVLVINKLTADFSISQIAQIVESSNAKILGILVNKSDTNTEIEVKIQTDDINDVIQTFRRYDYNIISQFEEDMHLQELKDHSDFLRKYLEIGK
jgi:predicted transcriptional regulator